MKKLAILLGLALCAALPVWADGPDQGESEVSLSFSYSDFDLGEKDDVDFGTSTSIDLTLSYGYYLTEHHEVGGLLSYNKEEIESGGTKVDTDGYGIGAFYHFNFSGGEVATPFVGASVTSIGGDSGDVYDLGYEILLGVKFYPFDNGGVLVAASWSQLQAADEIYDDASGLQVVAGILLKY
ncbi:MAG: autotransporter outer membrane beta-barrel domain-containing protein [Acidobacteria bacterium]|nr:autotransporter outer membrane beta-barrel domain-containing protein [Acidobacteriota bacterium]